MNNPKNILVVISGRRKNHEALARALTYAFVEDVHIHIFSVIYEPLMTFEGYLSNKHVEELKQQYIADRYLYLDHIAKQLDDKGIKCSVWVEWFAELHQAIEEAARVVQPDLVIKRISASADSKNPFAMPVDRHLLRYCPTPLLLINDAKWRQGPITLAIDTDAQDDAHVELNERIILCGKQLSTLTENEINVVSTYTLPSTSPAVGLPGVDFDLIRHETLKAREKKLQALLAAHDIPIANIHIIEGAPERAIPRFVQETNSQLLVLGTVGRTGISGLFIGNTSEKILAELSCEILALKPRVNT
jgi:universal stress protein E